MLLKKWDVFFQRTGYYHAVCNLYTEPKPLLICQAVPAGSTNFSITDIKSSSKSCFFLYLDKGLSSRLELHLRLTVRDILFHNRLVAAFSPYFFPVYKLFEV